MHAVVADGVELDTVRRQLSTQMYAAGVSREGGHLALELLTQGTLLRGDDGEDMC
jgi:hypothetical protein